MRVEPWTPLGVALADYHRGERHHDLYVASDLWAEERVDVAEYYRPLDRQLPLVERRALSLCRGRVLDAGAGAGRHALELQARGLQVTALDLSSDAVEVMRSRGVDDVRHGDLFSLAGELFDTVLLMMHGIGIVGDVAGLGRFLEQVSDLLAPGGYVVFDSAGLEAALSVQELGMARSHRASGAYLGEVEFSLRYRELQGAPYPWLFVDPDTVGLLCGAAGLGFELAATGPAGAYLGRITLGEG